MAIQQYPSVSGQIVDIDGNQINPAKEDGNLATVAGSLDVDLSTIAKDATLTGGGQKSQLVDGSGNVISSTSNRLNVRGHSESETEATVPSVATLIGGVNASGNLLAPTVEQTCSLFNLLYTAAFPAKIVHALSGIMFSFQYNLTVSASSEDEFMLIRNPSGSGKNLIICEASFDIRTADAEGMFGVYLNPTITNNGTTRTILNMKSGGAAPTAAIGSTVPTTTNFGSRIIYIGRENGGGAVNTIPALVGIVIAPGNSLLITFDGEGSNLEPTATIQFAEVTA